MDELYKKHMNDQTNNLVRFERIEKDIEDHSRRLAGLEELTDTIHSLANSIERMCTELKTQSDELKSQGKRISLLEQMPGDKWKKLTDTLLTAIAGGLVGYFLF